MYSIYVSWFNVLRSLVWALLAHECTIISCNKKQLLAEVLTDECVKYTTRCIDSCCHGELSFSFLLRGVNSMFDSSACVPIRSLNSVDCICVLHIKKILTANKIGPLYFNTAMLFLLLLFAYITILMWSRTSCMNWLFYIFFNEAVCARRRSLQSVYKVLL